MAGDNSYISAFIKPIETLDSFRSNEQKICLATAMAMSIDVEHLYSWIDIKNTTKFDVHQQRVYGICLKKSEARMLIKEHAAFEFGEHAFKKRFTKAAYIDRFDREPPLGPKKALLATFAEWLHFSGHHCFPLQLPEELQQWLPNEISYKSS